MNNQITNQNELNQASTLLEALNKRLEVQLEQLPEELLIFTINYSNEGRIGNYVIVKNGEITNTSTSETDSIKKSLTQALEEDDFVYQIGNQYFALATLESNQLGRLLYMTETLIDTNSQSGLGNMPVILYRVLTANTIKKQEEISLESEFDLDVTIGEKHFFESDSRGYNFYYDFNIQLTIPDAKYTFNIKTTEDETTLNVFDKEGNEIIPGTTEYLLLQAMLRTYDHMIMLMYSRLTR